MNTPSLATTRPDSVWARGCGLAFLFSIFPLCAAVVSAAATAPVLASDAQAASLALTRGNSDLIWSNSATGERAIWLMDGTAFSSSSTLGMFPLEWTVAATGDFNGDGKPDLVWSNSITGERALWLMNGATFLASSTLGTFPLEWTVAATGDFNGDGKPDIIWSNRITGERAIWLMFGTSFLSSSTLGVFPLEWTVAATGDFNLDGKTDIVWSNSITGERAIWLMDGTNFLGSATLGVFPPEWTVAATGDFNVDGKTDIVWSNSASGERAIWLMNGTAFLSSASLGVFPSEWTIAGAADFNPLTAASDSAAARFLIQSSFGPTAASIADVRAGTFADWIEKQLALSPSYHLPYYRARAAEFLARSSGNDNGSYTPRQEAWWQNAMTAPDQLRQRMAFALSETLVISQDSSLDSEHEGATAYYDILVKNAFGNYRQLLEEVTLNPMMGKYLSMIRNRKPNTKTGSQPDENYAREIMQLFTIGLSQLNLDGTLVLDSAGLSIPTYTQADIVGLAHVFTGWGPYYDPANPPKWSDGTTAKISDWFLYGWDPLRPMTFNTTNGDLQPRQIVTGVSVSGTLTGPQRMKFALDTLFNHPNVGPFIGRQLIQRFVTSNPSPAYVQRVALAFNNNGAGVRGDLGATLKAVLLDPEARRPESLVDVKFGKLIEPLLRVARLLRAFPPTPRPYAATGDNRLFLNFFYSINEQAPLFSPTVFNFFKPGFAQAGQIAAAGLFSPEFQIFDDVTAMLETNLNYSLIYSGISVGEPSGTGTNMKLDLSEPLGILTATGRTHPAAQAALVDYLNLRLVGGNMSPFLRQEILDTFTSLPTTFTYTAANELKRVQMAVYLVMFSSDFNIQR